ncbi:MAG: tetratricopeptide repeat protein [Cyanobacteria bacterium SZAS-4]|nr:tetratricopeptide repeat protein [Cyanobacteria bacterium SZAS-4]
MYRFNLAHLCFAISLTLISAGSAVAQVSASDAAVLREHINKGNVYMGRGQWDQAIDEYEQALDTDPGSMVAKENLVLVHNNWGISLFQHHKYEEAKAQWEEALKMNPYDRNAKQNLSVLKQTLARIQAAPKPPVKPAAEMKEAGVKAGADDSNSSGPKMLGQPNKPIATDASSSGPKMLNATKPDESSSGPKMLSQPKSEEQPSGAMIMSNHAQEVPNVPAPPAVPPTTPEPPQVMAPATPTIDMSSPYSFVDTPAAKAAAEGSSPYGLPTNLTAPTAHPRPYIAPPVTPPAKPVNAWSVPASVSGGETEAPATSAATTPSESDSSANLEDQLGAIEVKLSGKKQKNLPILKRIEKLEMSISGKANSGSLQERIEALRKSCGL